MRVLKVFIIAFSILCSTACFAIKSYPDPQYRKADAASIGTFTAPMNVRLEIVFQRNGKDLPKAIKEVRPIIEKQLLGTKAFTIGTDAVSPLLRVTLNNVADMAEARKKGFLTGLTFGGKGSTITDYYEAKIELESADGTSSKEYKHALVSTLGHADVPFAGMTGMKPVDAFNVVIQDIILNFVQDMKTDGKLSRNDAAFQRFYAMR